MKDKVLIIAEAGVNHNGDLNIAKRLVDVAKMAGVDYVKFQLGIPELLISKHAPKANYQKRNTGEAESQLEMIKKISLSFAEHLELIRYCKERGVNYLCTPFDLLSIQFLNEQGIDMWKIPSGEITNYPYLVAIAKTGKAVVMSTGMSTVEEVESALSVLLENGVTSNQITLLHCTTEYPAPKNEVNLLAIPFLQKRFNMSVGYSDHTEGIEIPIAAVSLGAVIIEKHFTLDKAFPGPDHKASLSPAELNEMVCSIRNVEQALGVAQKIVTKSEMMNRVVARKSIVAKRDIEIGELLTEANLTTKRPGNGISPMLWNSVIGTYAIRKFEADEIIEI